MPTDAKPTDAKPTEVKPTEAKPAELEPAEAKPAEAKPAEAKPTKAKPIDTTEPKTQPWRQIWPAPDSDSNPQLERKAAMGQSGGGREPPGFDDSGEYIAPE